MSPDVGTAIVEFKEWVTLLVVILFGQAAMIYWQGKKVDRGCPHCPHCQARIREEEARQQAAREELDRRLNLPPATPLVPPCSRPHRCPKCDDGRDDEAE